MIMSIESGWLIKNSQFNQWISVEHFSKFTVFFFYIFLCSSPSNRIAMWVVHNPIRTFIYYAHNKKWTSLVVDLSHHITTFFCSCASSIFYFSMEWSWVLSNVRCLFAIFGNISSCAHRLTQSSSHLLAFFN